MLLDVAEGGPVAVALRERGSGDDEAATGGAPEPSVGWVVLPTAFGIDPRPSLVLVNGTDRTVTAQLRLLREGGASSDATTVSVPAHAAAAAPNTFLRADHTAAVLVSADGPVIALGAGAAGSGASARYATALGVPVPAGTFTPAP